jgi:hypothetical protein
LSDNAKVIHSFVKKPSECFAIREVLNNWNIISNRSTDEIVTWNEVVTKKGVQVNVILPIKELLLSVIIAYQFIKFSSLVVNKSKRKTIELALMSSNLK